MLVAAGGYDEAAHYLDRAVTLEPDNASALCELSAACHAQGDSEAAVALALRAAALTPGDHRIAIHAAELLIGCGRAAEAAEFLRNAAANEADPRLLRVLSAAEMVGGRLEAALDAVEPLPSPPTLLILRSTTSIADICCGAWANLPALPQRSTAPPRSIQRAPSSSARNELLPRCRLGNRSDGGWRGACCIAFPTTSPAPKR